MYEGSSFSTSLLTLAIFCFVFKILPELVGVKYYLIIIIFFFSHFPVG